MPDHIKVGHHVVFKGFTNPPKFLLSESSDKIHRVDGKVVELGVTNRFEVGYSSNHSKSQCEPIGQYEIDVVERNIKVVEELINSKGKPRLKIVYIHCFDWSNKSDRMIQLWIEQFLDAEREKYNPPMVIVVQDKTFWPGFEFEGPLVLDRREAKEKAYKECPPGKFKPDHKKVNQHVVDQSLIALSKFFMPGVPKLVLPECKNFSYPKKAKDERTPFTQVEGTTSVKKQLPSALPSKCSAGDFFLDGLIPRKRRRCGYCR